ncbi:hypothetical protein HXX76_002771 [Chlamydomonas incerta]|uniref:Uncharacterized protein n=1 Tax=Chlamydomonas incerta TaxID=51695 RepID=A0A835TCP1_CHLIN|nr:hypothetical protein HXX76_002771 [Chlamydomonas incerta]|eukprot:KAG2442688.1 hypothetical protein HXX76_002771 [Chlamydomonas incerta]
MMEPSGPFDDLDDATVKCILSRLGSTDLRNTASILSKRFNRLLKEPPGATGGVWNLLEINVAHETLHPRGRGAPPAPPHVLPAAPTAMHTSATSTTTASSSRDHSTPAAHYPSSYHRSQAPSHGFNPLEETYFGRSRSHLGRGDGHGGHGVAAAAPRRRAFLSRAALSRWLVPYQDQVTALHVSHTELRTTVVPVAAPVAAGGGGGGRGPRGRRGGGGGCCGGGDGGGGMRHDLQPEDLEGLLAALPRLSELVLRSASDLLPDPGVLLQLQLQPPQLQPQPPGLPAARPERLQPAAAAAAGVSAGLAAAGGEVSPGCGGGPRSPQQLLRPPPALPLAARLQRLALLQTGYCLRSSPLADLRAAAAPAAAAAAAGGAAGAAAAGAVAAGAAAAAVPVWAAWREAEAATQLAGVAALGGLPALTCLELGVEPPSAEGLSRLPEAWSALTGLTALRLTGHQALRRLPAWLPGRLRRLRELELVRCGFRLLPEPALSGLSGLRLLALDGCPLGEGEAAVSLDAWWPPEPEPSRARKGSGGGGGDGGGGGGGGEWGWEQAARAAGVDVHGAGAAGVVASGYAMSWSGGGGDQGAPWEDPTAAAGGAAGSGAAAGAVAGGGSAWGEGDAAAAAAAGVVAAAGADEAGGGGGGCSGCSGVLGLEVLRLRDCGVLALPYAISRLTRLQTLELAGNPMGDHALPAPSDDEDEEEDAAGGGGGGGGRRRGGGGGGDAEALGHMGRLRASVLRYLRESGDRGFELLEGCSGLRHLGLARCGLAALPPAVAGGLLAGLTSLDVSGNAQLQLQPLPLQPLPVLQPQQLGQWRQPGPGVRWEGAGREGGGEAVEAAAGAGAGAAAALAQLRRALPALRRLELGGTPAAGLAAAREAELGRGGAHC